MLNYKAAKLMGKSYLRKYTLLLRSVISFEIP